MELTMQWTFGNTAWVSLRRMCNNLHLKSNQSSCRYVSIHHHPTYRSAMHAAPAGSHLKTDHLRCLVWLYWNMREAARLCSLLQSDCFAAQQRDKQVQIFVTIQKSKLVCRYRSWMNRQHTALAVVRHMKNGVRDFHFVWVTKVFLGPPKATGGSVTC